jgi:hypothetical protein
MERVEMFLGDRDREHFVELLEGLGRAVVTV